MAETFDIEAGVEPTLLSSTKKTTKNEQAGTKTVTVEKKFSDGSEEITETTTNKLESSKIIKTTKKLPDGTEETTEKKKKLKCKEDKSMSPLSVSSGLTEISHPPEVSKDIAAASLIAVPAGAASMTQPTINIEEHHHHNQSTNVEAKAAVTGGGGGGGCCCCCGASPDGKPGNCMAASSLVCGIIGIFIFGVILGTLAIIFGSVALCQVGSEPEKFNPNSRCLAISGIICGCFSFLIWLVLFIFWF